MQRHRRLRGPVRRTTCGALCSPAVTVIQCHRQPVGHALTQHASTVHIEPRPACVQPLQQLPIAHRPAGHHADARQHVGRRRRGVHVLGRQIDSWCGRCGRVRQRPAPRVARTNVPRDCGCWGRLHRPGHSVGCAGLRRRHPRGGLVRCGRRLRWRQVRAAAAHGQRRLHGGRHGWWRRRCAVQHHPRRACVVEWHVIRWARSGRQDHQRRLMRARLRRRRLRGWWGLTDRPR